MADSGMPREDEALRLRSVGSLAEYTVVSGDGDIGTVREFYFDDDIWAIRYLAVYADIWLPGRKLLISPLALKSTDWELPKLTVPFTKAELKATPVIGLDGPVTRRHQIDMYLYYGWLPYWLEEEYYDVSPPPRQVESKQSPDEEKAADPHLFGTSEMIEFRIEALDGDVGHIEDFIMDEDDWVIHYLVVALDDPNPEVESHKSVLISTEWVQKIVRSEERVYVDLDRERVMSSPEYDPALPISREFELEIYDHYGRPRYWVEGGDTEEEEDMRFLS
ncbi:MAG: hypothetical protein K8I29_18395 [Alphaproteobacteria bacterium]|uniref:PRC-barrel domain containing protein n=1 Tax=Candidatus Nitrobium versatile TaxID=2884831 RepID=A0A953SGP1_9BACT|nr:hypothetical protein [Candidatus Nitrobium versatile]